MFRSWWLVARVFVLVSTVAAVLAPQAIGAAPAPAWSLQQVLRAPNPGGLEFFGWSVDLSASGTTAVVGAPFTDGNVGAAYVFVNGGTGWVQQAELTASDRSARDLFGDEVAISDDGSAVVLGAPGKTVAGKLNAGAAYVFTRSRSVWAQRAELVGKPSGRGNNFGSSVAISAAGNRVGIGAPSRSVSGHRLAGAAYAFTRRGDGWSQSGFVTSSTPGANQYFGSSVAVSDSLLLVGAPGDYTTGADAVFVFDRSGGSYVPQATLTAPTGRSNEEFGAAMDLSRSTLVVGAPFHVAAAGGQGTAYVFSRSGRTGVWTERAELAASDGGATDEFGTAVAIGNGTVVVGTPYHDAGPNLAYGGAYVFGVVANAWVQTAEFNGEPDNGRRGTNFANSVAVSGALILVSEPDISSNGVSGAGVVDVFGPTVIPNSAALLR